MKKRIGKAAQYTFILVLGFVMIYPVLWMIAGSFQNR
jgi:multiple sugar transport system permease protein